MRVMIAGTGEPDRVTEALDTLHDALPITLMGIRDPDSPAATWARRHGIPTTIYIPEAQIDLGVVMPEGGASVEAWHARMLMDNVPCMEIHP